MLFLFMLLFHAIIKNTKEDSKKKHAKDIKIFMKKKKKKDKENVRERRKK